MSMASASSDSDFSGPRQRSIHSQGSAHNVYSQQVDHLAHTLKDTNKNLRAVDRMLEEYRDLGDQQTSVVNKLRDDVSRSPTRHDDRSRRPLRSPTRQPARQQGHHSDPDQDYGRDRRQPTSPLREYERSASDREFSDDYQHQRRLRGAVRFHDDMDADESLHELHQSVRDITSDQLRIGDDLNREIAHRNRFETEQKKSIQHMQELVRQPDPAISSVDKRLESIQNELRSERVALKHKSDEVGKMSSELKEALTTHKQAPTPSIVDPTAEENAMLRSKLQHFETQKGLVEIELDKTRRRLEQTEGSRQTVIRQVDELKKQLVRSDEERQRLRSNWEHTQEEGRQRRTVNEGREVVQRDVRRLEEEVRDLRSQLSRSAAAVTDYGELRRNYDKSEQQRAQLSQHIEVLNKDVEEKERLSAKVLHQMQDLTEKFDACEQQRRSALIQLEDTLKQLQTATRQGETGSSTLKDTQKHLKDAETKVEEVKARAQETVRQWKVKCKKLEREADRFKHSTQQVSERHEQLVRELEGMRSHGNTAGHQLDHIKREFSDMLAIRAQQDEQVRLKDIQVNELKSLKMDLEKELRDAKMVIEQLEHEMHAVRERQQKGAEEHNLLEERSAAADMAHKLSHTQLQQAQKELQDASITKVELSSQLADVASERQELKCLLAETRKKEQMLREEAEAMRRHLLEEREVDRQRMEVMRIELEGYSTQESQRLHEVTRRYKKERAEYEAELRALKIELDEDRTTAKMLRKRQESHTAEVDRLNSELTRSKEEIAVMQEKFHHAREEFITKSQMSEDGLLRSHEMEEEVVAAREAAVAALCDQERALCAVAAEVDATVEAATITSSHSYKPPSVARTQVADPQLWITDIKSKLEWLRAEMREQRVNTTHLRTTVKDAAHQSELDRQFLVAEIERQNVALDTFVTQPHHNHSEMVDRPERDVEEVLQCQEDISSDSENSLKHQGIDTLLQETKKEREKIHERYAKLQETMCSLRQELTETKIFAEGNLAKEKVNYSTHLNSCLDFKHPDTLPKRDPSPIRNHGYPSNIPEVDEEMSEVVSEEGTPSSRSATSPPLVVNDDEFINKLTLGLEPRAALDVGAADMDL